jgi:hypothetical protein
MYHAEFAVLAKMHVWLTTEGPPQHDTTGFVEKIVFADECTLQFSLSCVV